MAPSGSAGLPARQPRRLADEAPPEAQRNRLSPVGSTQLAEQPPSVGLHRVLREVELAADFAVALPRRHAVKHLALALGQLRRAAGRGRELPVLDWLAD